MKGRFGPTLMRRVFLAILIVYPVIWIAMMTQEYYLESTTLSEKVPKWMADDSQILDRYATTQEVVAYMQSAILVYWNFGGALPKSIELWSKDGSSDGKRVFFEEFNIALHPPPTGNLAARSLVVAKDGRSYDVFRRDGRRWALRVAIASFTWFDIIKRDVGDLSLNLSMLISLPILMLPLWFAIRRGLLPFHVLSNRLAERETENLAPLDFDVKYGELKPVATALDSLLLRLRGKVAREQMFVQDAAHELRTPMAVISAQVHVLATAATALDKRAAERDIDEAIARASHLIQQLLELARVDGMRPLDSQILDVAQLVGSDLAQLVPTAMARDIEISLDAPETLPYALERNTFQSILHNLIDNAIRYGHAGGAVAVDLKMEGGSLLLSVADDGPGIPAAEQEQVFERFYRCAGHDVPGSGLGLAIARQAATRLGGTVTLGAGLGGKGCRFSVLIAAGGAGAAERTPIQAR